MRSFRPPRSTGLYTASPPIGAPASVRPSVTPSAPPPPDVTPLPEPDAVPAPVFDEVPDLTMDCTPMLTGLLRGRAPQPGTVALICTDDMLRERLRRDLEEDGYQVLASASGPALIPMLVGATPGVLLVHEDVVDPEPFEISCTVRDDPALADFEVVLASSQTSVDARRVAFHAGAVDLLLLPYLRSELRARVGLRLELQRLRMTQAADSAGERAAG